MRKLDNMEYEDIQKLSYYEKQMLFMGYDLDSNFSKMYVEEKKDDDKFNIIMLFIFILIIFLMGIIHYFINFK